MSLLSRIKKLREANGSISINRLEKEAGLSRGSMAKWDDHAPSYDKLKKVADYFNVSPHYLLTGEADTQKSPPPDGSGQIGPAKQKLLEAVDDMSEAELAILFERIQKIKESRV